MQGGHYVIVEVYIEERLLPNTQTFTLRAELGAACLAFVLRDGPRISPWEAFLEDLNSPLLGFLRRPHLTTHRVLLPLLLHETAEETPVIACTTSSHRGGEKLKVAAEDGTEKHLLRRRDGVAKADGVPAVEEVCRVSISGTIAWLLSAFSAQQQQQQPLPPR